MLSQRHNTRDNTNQNARALIFWSDSVSNFQIDRMFSCLYVGARWRGVQGDSPDGIGMLLAEHEGSGHGTRTSVSQSAFALH